MTTKIWGIDVSKYNYPINWKKVKAAGVKFAILRIGFSSISNRNNLYIDPYFETFYKDAKAVGMPVGAYFYSRCNGPITAKAEANFILKSIKGKQFEYPIWLDVEDNSNLSSMSKETATNAVKTCLELIEKEGYYVGLYSGKYILRDKLIDSDLKDYDRWIAQYSKECTYTTYPISIWQFGGETNLLRNKKIDGIGNDVADQNYCYIDYPSIIKSKGLNGFKKPSSNTYVEFKIKTKTDMNIRKEASLKGKILTKSKKGEELKIAEISKDGKWGHTGKGWVSLNTKYIEKV